MSAENVEKEEAVDALATPEYWDKRYATSDGQNATHEWFRSYQALVPFLKKNLFDVKPPEENPHILHLGSGDSTMPHDLAVYGYRSQLCVDFSTNVVEMMAKRHSQDEGVRWQWADVRDMPDIPDGSIDVAFDKGTMDAMIHGSPWDPPDDVKENTGRYLKEVHRVLNDRGVFLYITFRQPHFIRPLLKSNDIWDIEMEIISEGASVLEYFGFILRKRAPTP